MKRRRNAWTCASGAACLVLVVGLGSAAWGRGTRAEAEDEFLTGVAHFKGGEVPRAIASFEKALAMDPHPTLLYDLAVLLDRAGQTEKAAAYYRRYLETSPPDADLVMARLSQAAPKVAEELVRAQEAKSGTGGKHAGQQPSPPGTAPGLVAEGPTSSPAAVGAAGRPTLLSFVLLGAGALGLGAGGALGMLTATDVDGFVTAVLDEDKQAAKKHADDARSHQILANAAYAVGGAAVLGGVLLVLLGGEGGEESTVEAAAPGSGADVVVVPLVAPDGSGAALQLTF